MDMESLYDYGEEDQDFYDESPGTRKGYPIDHRSIKVSQYFDRFRSIRVENKTKTLANFMNAYCASFFPERSSRMYI